jgi:signal transduction histidine kinase
VTRPRLTVRVRLTLLYTSLFAACGLIVVAITYGLVAHLPVEVAGPGQEEFLFPDGNPAGFLARCDQARKSLRPDQNLLHKCDTLLQHLGALSQRDATVSYLLDYSLITLAVVIALAALAGWIIAGRALRPVHRITAAARAASEQDLSTRVALTGPRDELRDLADTFDTMLARLQTAFEGQQRFIANASHELRTPLTVVRATADVVLAKPDPAPGELRSMGQDIRAAVDHAEALVGALLTLARTEHGLPRHDDVDLATVAEDALDTVDGRDRHVHASLEPAVTSGDPVLLERLIANLVDNGGDIWLTTITGDNQARLDIANTGPLISHADVDGLFEPFRRLTDRTTADGFGLGLALVASITAVHRGTVTARPRDGGGLCITVALPQRRPR